MARRLTSTVRVQAHCELQEFEKQTSCARWPGGLDPRLCRQGDRMNLRSALGQPEKDQRQAIISGMPPIAAGGRRADMDYRDARVCPNADKIEQIGLSEMFRYRNIVPSQRTGIVRRSDQRGLPDRPSVKLTGGKPTLSGRTRRPAN